MWTGFSLLFWTFSICFVNSSASSLTQKMQNNISVSTNGSCFGRCNNYSSFKCSCSVRCQIDGNCCQDFQETCPQTFNQSIARFSEFLQSLQECKYSEYLMISRCPSENYSTQQPSSSFQFDNTSGLISEALQNIAEGHGAVSLLFRHVPVIDLDSGVTFKNLTIYHCHNMSGRNLFFWDVYIDNFQLGSHGELSFKSLSQAEFEVFPPKKLEEVESLLMCSKDQKLFYKLSWEYSKSQFHTKAKTLKEHSSLCDLCSNHNESIEENYLMEKIASFPMQASFFVDHFDFNYVDSYNGYKKPIWKKLICYNPKNESKSNVSYCEMDGCLDLYVQIRNGECKIEYLLELAVPEDDSLISTKFINRLTFYIECYLKSYADYDIINFLNDSYLYYNQNLGKIFYNTNFLLYSYTEVDIENNLDNVIYHFTNFATVIQSLKALRSEIQRSYTVSPPDFNTISSLTVEDSPKLYQLPAPFVLPKFNKLNESKDQIIPVCLYISPVFSLLSIPKSNLLLDCVYISVERNKVEAITGERNMCLSIILDSGHNFGPFLSGNKYMFCVTDSASIALL
ncbi:hypothetical protein BgiBS90_011741 [Biomphalaria glabrata]|nr:hypothetical protein BgiBS90_011741 [Biomphalaria glabrata]